MTNDRWPINLQGMLVATLRRHDVHPDNAYCNTNDPCDRCRPLLNTIAYNRTRIPRWVLIIGDTTTWLAETVYDARDRVAAMARMRRR